MCTEVGRMCKSKLYLTHCTSHCFYRKGLTFKVQTNLKTSSPSAMSQQEVFNQYRLSKDEMGQGELVLLGIRNYTVDVRQALAGPTSGSKCPGTHKRQEVRCPLGTKCHHAGGTEDAEQVNMLPTPHQGALRRTKRPRLTESINIG